MAIPLRWKLIFETLLLFNVREEIIVLLPRVISVTQVFTFVRCTLYLTYFNTDLKCDLITFKH